MIRILVVGSLKTTSCVIPLFTQSHDIWSLLKYWDYLLNFIEIRTIDFHICQTVVERKQGGGARVPPGILKEGKKKGKKKGGKIKKMKEKRGKKAKFLKYLPYLEIFIIGGGGNGIIP